MNRRNQRRSGLILATSGPLQIYRVITGAG